MLYSTDRILVTHAGSLPRPPDLRAMVVAKAAGEAYDGDLFNRRLAESVAETVRRQLDSGIDIVNDGELSKYNFTDYVRGRIAGLSKIARLVDGFAARPQVQERLTTQVADALVEALEPTGVLVMIEAEHFCMSMRGVKKPGALTVTSAVRGLFRDNVATRAEAMDFLRDHR